MAWSSARRSRAIGRAIMRRLPVVIVSSSGGARMMEGRLADADGEDQRGARPSRPDAASVSVLTDPTTGGVATSFAMLGDVNIAEPKALTGCGAARHRQTIRSSCRRASSAASSSSITACSTSRRPAERRPVARVLRFGMTVDGPCARPAPLASPQPRRSREPRLVFGAGHPAVDFLFSLERLGMRFACGIGPSAPLGNPQNAPRSSSRAPTEGLRHRDDGCRLRAAGHHSARYPPHLQRIEERFVIDGE